MSKQDKDLPDHYKKSQAWYSKSSKVLEHLRLYMTDLIIEMDNESHDRFLKRIEGTSMRRTKRKSFKAAKKALAKAEKFFCNKAP